MCYVLFWQTASDIEEKKKSVEENKKTYQVKKKTLDVLPESEQTIAKVKVRIYAKWEFPPL